MGDRDIDIHVHLIGSGQVNDRDVIRPWHYATLPVRCHRPVATRRIDPPPFQTRPHRHSHQSRRTALQAIRRSISESGGADKTWWRLIIQTSRSIRCHHTLTNRRLGETAKGQRIAFRIEIICQRIDANGNALDGFNRVWGAARGATICDHVFNRHRHLIQHKISVARSPWPTRWQRGILQHFQTEPSDRTRNAFHPDSISGAIRLGPAHQHRLVLQHRSHRTTRRRKRHHLQHRPVRCHIAAIGQPIRKGASIIRCRRKPEPPQVMCVVIVLDQSKTEDTVRRHWHIGGRLPHNGLRCVGPQGPAVHSRENAVDSARCREATLSRRRRRILQRNRTVYQPHRHRFSHCVQLRHSRTLTRHCRVELGTELRSHKRLHPHLRLHLASEIRIVRRPVCRQQSERTTTVQPAIQTHLAKAVTSHPAIRRKQARSLQKHRSRRLPLHKMHKSRRRSIRKHQLRTRTVESIVGTRS